MKYQYLDITKEHCPMTFVKTKLKLEELKDDEILEVTLCAGEPLDNIPKTLQEQNYKILEIKHVKDDIYKILVSK